MRNNNRKTGNEAEGLVAEILAKKGYKILQRNYYSPYGEIDIVAQTGNTLVFVEVKFRRSNKFGTPAEGVTYTKQKRIVKAAEHYLFANDITETGVRFDVAEVYGYICESSVNIIENAFDAGQ